MLPPPANVATVAGTTQFVLLRQACSTTAKERFAEPIFRVVEQMPSLKPAAQLPAVVPNEAKTIVSIVWPPVQPTVRLWFSATLPQRVVLGGPIPSRIADSAGNGAAGAATATSPTQSNPTPIL